MNEPAVSFPRKIGGVCALFLIISVLSIVNAADVGDLLTMNYSVDVSQGGSSSSSSSSLSFTPATSSLLSWTGRRLVSPSGTGFIIDWEGTRMRATVCNASYGVHAVISDTSLGGARFGVWLNASSSEESHLANVPNLRVSTFYTRAGVNVSYAMAQRAGVQGSVCVTYTLQLLIEPAFIKDMSPDNVVTVEGLLTDGTTVSSSSSSSFSSGYTSSSHTLSNVGGGDQRRRRIEILGDSLTAGYGAGFDIPHSDSASCGGGGLVDDQAVTYGALLCANFSAECITEAVSGITLYTGRGFNLPMAWDWELGGMIQNKWPEEARVPYNASRFRPDAVIINLGENDWNAHCGTTFGCPANFTAAYVRFVEHIVDVYARAHDNKNYSQQQQQPQPQPIVFFLTIGPHERGQSEAIIPAVQLLKAKGTPAYFLNATVGDFGTIGCGGHPGITIHHAAFLRAQPVIAEVMGW